MSFIKWVHKNCRFAAVLTEEDIETEKALDTGGIDFPPAPPEDDDRWGEDDGEIPSNQYSLIWHKVLAIMSDASIANKIKPLFATFLSSAKRVPQIAITNRNIFDGTPDFSLWITFDFSLPLEQFEMQAQSFLKNNKDIWETFRQDSELLQKLPPSYSEFSFINDESVLDAAVRSIMAVFDRQGKELLETSPLFSIEKAKKLFLSQISSIIKSKGEAWYYWPDLTNTVAQLSEDMSNFSDNQWEDFLGEVDNTLKRNMSKEELNPINFLDFDYIRVKPIKIFTTHNASYSEKEIITLRLSKEFSVKVPVKEEILEKALAIAKSV